MRTTLRRATLVLAMTMAAATGGLAASQASAGPDPFYSGVSSYVGSFPDPDVLVDNGVYHAYSTTTANKNLPETTSTDLVHWATRFSNTPRCGTDRAYSCRWNNDAMTKHASWMASNAGGIWAPSVAHVGSHYVEVYVAPVSKSKRCVALATSSSPDGLFVDNTSRPVVCPQREGAIDPFIVLDGSGNPWLLWKTQGIPRVVGARTWSQQLTADGTALLPGSRPHFLMKTTQGWEGHGTENPAMVSYQGRWLLLYSGNRWESSSYAIGYALCSGPAGPCTKKSLRAPLLKSYGAIAGPGGATPFVGLDGNLYMIYAAWDAGHVGYVRRAYVASLSMDANGTVRVTDPDIAR